MSDVVVSISLARLCLYISRLFGLSNGDVSVESWASKFGHVMLLTLGEVVWNFRASMLIVSVRGALHCSMGNVRLCHRASRVPDSGPGTCCDPGAERGEPEIQGSGCRQTLTGLLPCGLRLPYRMDVHLRSFLPGVSMNKYIR